MVGHILKSKAHISKYVPWIFSFFRGSCNHLKMRCDSVLLFLSVSRARFPLLRMSVLYSAYAAYHLHRPRWLTE